MLFLIAAHARFVSIIKRMNAANYGEFGRRSGGNASRFTGATAMAG
jgi:hypothetical protein